MAITLSALYAGAITLNDGIAIILGSEIGTTIKLFIASINGAASKRRVALGNFLLNSINIIFVVIFLFPIGRLVTNVIRISDKLIGLVFFQSLVNILGIIFFHPFLGIFGRYLEQRFRTTEDETLFIHNADLQVPQAALIALEKEAKYFIYTALEYTLSCYSIRNAYRENVQLTERYKGMTLPAKYEHIKFLYGEIHSFYIRMQKNVSGQDMEKLDRLISSVRNTMNAAKNIKDAIPDMEQLANSANDVQYNFYKQISEAVTHFCQQIFFLLDEDKEQHPENLVTFYHTVTGNYTLILQQFINENIAGNLSETEITTLLNFNREIFTAFKSFVFGVKDYLFDKSQSNYFDNLPGFIR